MLRTKFVEAPFVIKHIKCGGVRNRNRLERVSQAEAVGHAHCVAISGNEQNIRPLIHDILQQALRHCIIAPIEMHIEIPFAQT